jgi:uncharacterized phage protein (TIGR01671 family)
MREIKFRAWNKEKKQMTPSFNLWSLTEDENFNLCLDGYGILYPSRVILMQFTGLHDKNGKEIYEGDIVRIITAVNEYYDEEGDLIEDENEKIAFISFDDGTFVAENSSGEICQWDDGTHDWYSLENAIILEVIGNIYENPELLKEMK